jgi:diguanylate cyclase (GGDEF)-like protein/PAS domain S-box-containing protein
MSRANERSPAGQAPPDLDHAGFAGRTETRMRGPAELAAAVARSSSLLARRALLMTNALAIAGAVLGLIAARQGAVSGPEIGLIFCCLVFSGGTLLTLLFFPNVALETVAIVTTVYFGIHLSAGSIVAATGAGQHFDFFIYLVWFFPLLAFNRLVNGPAMGRFLGKTLLVVPVLISACLFSRLTAIFEPGPLFALAAYLLSYTCSGLMLNTVARYREDYIVERERAESLRTESELLESISDCFISLDVALRLVYLNDAACGEFGVERGAALRTSIVDAIPDFLSPAMFSGLQTASVRASASLFEAPDLRQERWYEMRCFPRPHGMSIYFRNITESISSRRKLNAAQKRLSEQAELLDKAQDAIIVADMDDRIVYWNKGAERLYGWNAHDATGRIAAEVFATASTDVTASAEFMLAHVEWSGELSHFHRDGTRLSVESRRTLVRAEDGAPRAVLAINTDITNRKAAEARVEHLAFYDVLTDLPNRLLLRERLARSLTAARGQGHVGALLSIDLDDFKTINDTLGHAIGDLLLTQVGRRLTACARGDATVARIGGDEFVVLLECSSSDAATRSAQTLAGAMLEALCAPFQLANYECTSTAAIGITFFPESTDSVDTVLKRAEFAMSCAKAQGRNAMCLFDTAMQTVVALRATLVADLRRALQNREFELQYQPQVDRTGRVTGAEALLRWHHPERGTVPPNEFISLAEEAGLIVELGKWVLEEACRQIAAWSSNADMEPLTVAVNVSVRQFVDANFVNLVLDVLRGCRADPNRLKLEITESSVMEKVEDTIAKMTALKVHSVGFSIDDFGTGYSSLSHLRRLPLDQLKIDRSFVNDVLTDETDASIARAIITLGQNLNLAVIAEGVETQAQLEFLEEAGCHAYQGFLFSPALSACDFQTFVAASLSREAAAPVR